MRSPRKLLSLPPAEALALVEGAIVLLLLRFALRVFRFQRLRRVLLRAARGLRRRGFLRLEIDRLIWAVTTAKRVCPVATTCLGEALMAETLFCQHGQDAVLCIGASHKDGAFTAHAWLENAGSIVIGGPASFIQQYTRFSDLDGAPQ